MRISDASSSYKGLAKRHGCDIMEYDWNIVDFAKTPLCLLLSIQYSGLIANIRPMAPTHVEVLLANDSIQNSELFGMPRMPAYRGGLRRWLSVVGPYP